MENYELREIKESDLERVLTWWNSERISQFMYTDALISSDEHQAWFHRMKSDINTSFHIFEVNDTPVGVIHFYQIDRKNNKCM